MRINIRTFRATDWILASAVLTVCALFAWRLGGLLVAHETPYLATDSYDYFQRTQAIFAFPSLETIHGFDRPLFCWWLPMLASWLSVPLSVGQLAFLNDLSAFVMLLVGIALMSRGRRNALLGVSWALCFILSVYPSNLLSLPHSLMGDFYLSGYILMTEGLFQQWERKEPRSWRWAVATGLALGGGIQTKPIFLFWALPRLLFSASRGLLERKKINWASASVFAAFMLVAAIALVSRKMLYFMQLQYLHNEVLRIHQLAEAKNWFYVTWCTFFSSKRFAIKIVEGLLVSGVLLSLVVRIRELRHSELITRKSVLLKEILARVKNEPGVLAILFCVGFLTFFVAGKDFRTTQFLFMLSTAWVAIKSASLIRDRRVVMFCSAGTLISLAVVGKQFVDMEFPFLTFERIGYDRMLQIASEDAKTRGMPIEATKKILVSAFYNEFTDSAVRAYQNTRCGLTFATASCHPSNEFETHSAPFPYGGWEWAGGFPKEFFTADYIVILSVATPETSGLYNDLISEKLRHGDSEFQDGLTRIADIKFSPERSWIVYRRDRTVSSKAFQAVIEQALRVSPDNVWNEPLRIAFERMNNSKFDPYSDVEKKRRQRLLTESTSDLQATSWGKEVALLMKGAPAAFEEARYPQIVKYSKGRGL